MNAWDIQRAVMRDRWRRNFMLPNYTPSKWWECDLFELTESGFFREYEVKISRADFFADAKKQSQVYPWPYGKSAVFENKHALLTQRDPRCPAQFWFVTPAGLVKPEEVPEWAGLIELSGGSFGEQIGDKIISHSRLSEREVIKAPRLHRVKFSSTAAHAMTVCYWRMHAEFGTAEPKSFINDPDTLETGAGI